MRLFCFHSPRLDQYVIPGNIIYKQRGTIWHPGENTIMGRDHTIHAAVAGYVKYYRDPHRHPDRKYIGVAFNREDKLPYPPGTPRRRKLGLVAVPRRTEEPVQETMSPSGIPLAVTRHEHVEQPVAEAGTSGAAGTSAPVSASAQAGQDSDNKAAPAPAPVPEPESEPVRLTDGNAVVSSLIKDKLRSRAAAQARREARRQQQLRELEARKGTRVFRLQPDYSYRETNWEIGRLVGDVGSVPGAEKTESRKAKFRLRRRKRVVYFRGLKKRKLAKVARREEYRRRVREKRARRIQQRAEAAAALKAAAAAAAAAKPKEDAAKDNKVEA